MIDEVLIPCDDVILAIGQDNAFPWIERDIGLEFNEWECPIVDETTMMSTRAGVFFGGDSAFGPKNIIWAVAHAHEVAISIDKYCHGEDLMERTPRALALSSQKMGIHEWSYSNDYEGAERRLMPHVNLKERFKKIDVEVELGFTVDQVDTEVERCLNCDIQTVFAAKLCIECDACIDICPVDCLTITANGPEEELRKRLRVPPKTLSRNCLCPRICRKPRGSWSRTKTCACTAACAPNVAQPAHGTCKNRKSSCRRSRIRIRHTSG